MHDDAMPAPEILYSAEEMEARLDGLRAAIRDTVAQRDRIKAAMECWYDKHPGKRFPQINELLLLDEKLCSLDSRYKRLWDAQQSRTKP